MPEFYIGFTKLEEFIIAADPGRPINLAPITHTKHGDHISTVSAFVIASQVKRDQLIYCKMNAARWEELYGEPFGERAIDCARQAQNRQKQLWNIAARIIRGVHQENELNEGAPSFPSDLILIDGWPECAIYNKDTNTIELKD